MIEAFIPINPNTVLNDVKPDVLPCEQVTVGEPNLEGQNTWHLNGQEVLATPGAWNVWRVYEELESYGYCKAPFTKAEGAKIRWGHENFSPLEPVPSEGGKALGEFVAKQALTWTGVHYRQGVKERCAEWVRHVYGQINVPVGKAAASWGPLMADSFYGEEGELGKMIFNPKDLRPGDIVMYENTYSGPGRVLPGYMGKSKITHVAIYVGEGMIVDRPTSQGSVRHRSLHTFKFHSALRPHALL
jgi:hypothetical protein